MIKTVATVVAALLLSTCARRECECAQTQRDVTAQSRGGETPEATSENDELPPVAIPPNLDSQPEQQRAVPAWCHRTHECGAEELCRQTYRVMNTFHARFGPTTSSADVYRTLDIFGATVTEVQARATAGECDAFEDLEEPETAFMDAYFVWSEEVFTMLEYLENDFSEEPPECANASDDEALWDACDEAEREQQRAYEEFQTFYDLLDVEPMLTEADHCFVCPMDLDP